MWSRPKAVSNGKASVAMRFPSGPGILIRKAGCNMPRTNYASGAHSPVGVSHGKALHASTANQRFSGLTMISRCFPTTASPPTGTKNNLFFGRFVFQMLMACADFLSKKPSDTSKNLPVTLSRSDRRSVGDGGWSTKTMSSGNSLSTFQMTNQPSPFLNATRRIEPAKLPKRVNCSTVRTTLRTI